MFLKSNLIVKVQQAVALFTDDQKLRQAVAVSLVAQEMAGEGK
jgi:hypothetical protein